MLTLHISKHGYSGGGASRAGFLLSKAMGTQATLFTYATLYGSHKLARLFLASQRYSRRLTGTDWNWLDIPALMWASRGHKILHFHDVWGAVSPITIGILSLFKRCVITVHDQSAFTGGCMYSYKCTRFTKSCGTCPQDYATIDLSRVGSLLRRLCLGRVSAIAPSQWMANLAEQSQIFSQVTHIPNCVDVEYFLAVNRAAARHALGVTNPCILVAANSLQDPRKDVMAALEVINGLPANYQVIAFGRDADILGKLQRPVRYLGHIADNYTLRLAYGAADFFLFTSHIDNLPLSLIEAISSGCSPVILDRGGSVECITPGMGFSALTPQELQRYLVTMPKPNVPQLQAHALSFSPSTIAHHHTDYYAQL